MKKNFLVPNLILKLCLELSVPTYLPYKIITMILLTWLLKINYIFKEINSNRVKSTETYLPIHN